MNIFPAIDLYDGKVVRLFKGDYSQMTVYSDNPLGVAKDFEAQGAKYIHMVDLEGAKSGGTPNFEIVSKIAQNTGLFTEIGGGIRSLDTVEKYLSAGLDRVVLGTAAVNDPAFLRAAVGQYGDKIAVGADIKDGFVAVKGWTETSEYSCFDFCKKMCEIGIKTLICTDISRDGAMKGTNRELVKELSEKFDINITASGGVSSLEDIKALKKLNLYGAIIGKAYYIGAISLKEALEAAK